MHFYCLCVRPLRPRRRTSSSSSPTTSATAISAATARRRSRRRTSTRSAQGRDAVHRRPHARRRLHADAVRAADRPVRLAAPARRRASSAASRRCASQPGTVTLAVAAAREPATRPASSASGTSASARRQTDYNGEIKPGPREVGFDYSFIIPATGDRMPCVYVENGTVVGYDPKDPIRVSYSEEGRRRADRARRTRNCSQSEAEPRPRHDDRERHQPDRLDDRRQGGPLEGRGHGRRHHEARPSAFIERQQGQAVLPLLRHARRPRPARAAPAISRARADTARAATAIQRTRLVRRRGAGSARQAQARPTTRSSSSPATTAA